MTMTSTQVRTVISESLSEPAEESEDDRLAELVEIAVEACRDVERVARLLDAGLPRLLEARRQGLSFAKLKSSQVSAVGYEFGAALKAVHRSLAELRRELYRSAIDDDGLTLTEMARLSGNSRQRIARQVKRARLEAG
ncbi:hypothetical protein [Streptomyces anulatus]|uniref:hypothetical protein n=1 Tax=Streptomyces anulatus TaxID=1892 RepID=UPI0037212BFC